ncbi:MAG TPA: gamma-glutamyltransferase [Thermoanaerobaculia bacterium]|nr:gamma-glutamyltransferase [Thermoanaerobaculia bacterium]
MIRAPFLAATLLIATSTFAGGSVTAKKAALSTAHPLATKAGLAVLQKGGTAADAAVAVAFALSVVHPQAGGLGGGGFLVYYDAQTRGVWTLDFRELSPRGVTRDAFAKPAAGAMSAGVPGTVAGLAALHERFGRRTWKELVEPSAAMARQGFVADAELLTDIASARERKLNVLSEATLGKPLPQSELAATLQKIAEDGPKAFYDGDLSKKFVEFVQDAGGLIGYRDLREYQPVWRAPIMLRYGAYELYTVSPPSSGGVVMGETLNILANDDLAAAGFQTTKAVHLFAEATRRASIDASRYVADPQTARIPYRDLLSHARAAQWRKTIDTTRAIATAGLTEPTELAPEGEHTTHFTIADAEGNVIALTMSLGDLFGSGFHVAPLGFFLNSAMNDFTPGPGPNIVDPNKRAASPLAPTIILRDHRPFLALGTRGGPAIPSTILQVFLNMVVYRKPLAAAIAAPRYHQQDMPDQLLYERRLAPKAIVDALNAMGHGVGARDSIGDVHAILFENGRLIAVADSRRGGAAGGY